MEVRRKEVVFQWNKGFLEKGACKIGLEGFCKFLQLGMVFDSTCIPNTVFAP